MKKELIILMFLMVGVVVNVSSQGTIPEKEHDHFHTNEIGVSFAPVYFTRSQETFFGLHGHYVRRLGESRFGAGAGTLKL